MGDAPTRPLFDKNTLAIVLLIALICGVTLLLYLPSILGPVLFMDDFDIFASSRTWQRTCHDFWTPHNEHGLPLGRLLCFLLGCMTSNLSRLPSIACWTGLLSVLMGLLLLYIFVRCEMGHSFYALLAIILFGVTTTYHASVWWFSASFSVFSLDMTLVGLLFAQAWRQTDRPIHLFLCAFACMLAPGWFTMGVLAGPLCCLYLLAANPIQDPKGSVVRRGLLILAPLAGTMAFLAVSLPYSAKTIWQAAHYDGKTTTQSFQPIVGLGFTLRAIVDHLFLGLLGVANVSLPVWCVGAILMVAAFLGVWWWRQASNGRLLLLGLGMIGSYLLIYSARGWLDYSRMIKPDFSRYHLFPQLGLVLFICGGLSGTAARWLTIRENETLTRQQWKILLVLLFVSFAVHLPRGLIYGHPALLFCMPLNGKQVVDQSIPEVVQEIFRGEAGTGPSIGGWRRLRDMCRRTHKDQSLVLRHIDEVDALCRQNHIDGDAARNALDVLNIPLAPGGRNGWSFLCGSNSPRQLSQEEVRQLLHSSKL